MPVRVRVPGPGPSPVSHSPALCDRRAWQDDGSVSLSTKMLEGKPGEMLKDAAAVYERAATRAQEAAVAGDQVS